MRWFLSSFWLVPVGNREGTSRKPEKNQSETSQEPVRN